MFSEQDVMNDPDNPRISNRVIGQMFARPRPDFCQEVGIQKVNLIFNRAG